MTTCESKEAVALALMQIIANAEGWSGKASREQVLQTYAQCLQTVSNPFAEGEKIKKH